jgi:hypothetical protein
MTLTLTSKDLDAPLHIKFRIHEPGEGEQLQG